MTETTSSATPVAAPGDWHRIFEPLAQEHDYVVDEIDGRLPEDLTGTLYRNGPGTWEQGGSPLCHLLEGDGMVSAYTLDGKSVRFRNRYVRTPAYRDGLAGLRHRTAGTLIPGGPAANADKPIAQQANTNVIEQGGQLLAFYGGALPWQLDPATLDTVGEVDYNGMLGPDRPGFSAHPKRDPESGILFNFSHTGGRAPALHTYAVHADGRGERLGSVAVPFADWVHDFAITERHFVFALAPFQYDFERFRSGAATPLDALHVHEDLGSRFVIIPKAGGPARIIEHETFAYFHVTNAYDDGEDIVFEASIFEHGWEHANRAMFDFRTGGSDYFANRPWRYRITPTDTVLAEPVSDIRSDWPQLDWRQTGRQHRFSYHATTDAATAAGGLAQIDHATGRTVVHQLPAGNVVGEPSFVPRHRRAAENDGWVLFGAYDPTRHRSRLVILDARDVGGEAVAVAHLRHHVPQTFHGSFSLAAG
ncbi:carotenoid oxygenase family protein [Mycolicibacterium sp.]|uniref:carotenoid oxygenase family protein n=1 Tax=Mycolicibacterium sp. TaxID=2320850 RepID=UPI003D0B737D